MNLRIVSLRSVVAVAVATILLSVSVFAQGDVPRQTVSITYPLDETINVRFRGTTLLPRIKGDAKVRRAGRRGTRVELSINGLPRAHELGGIYTTYVLWAISPDGRVENMGEIKRSGSMFVNSKIDVTTTLQTFALIVTAEPHFLMKVPSRMVILENLPPQRPGSSQIETATVQYIGNSSDYFRDARVPEIADKDYRDTPVTLLGARQAVNLARFAGASQDAPDELAEAEADLEAAEKAWRFNEATADIDVMARKAISAGARAEEMAVSRRTARLRREEIRKRDEALRSAERTADAAQREIAQLRAALDREERARELAERDAASASEQLREARIELARLRDELQSVRAEGDDARIRLARMEGERQADEARRDAEIREQERRASHAALKAGLGKFGSVQESAGGFVLVLPETLWTAARNSNLKAAGAARLDPLAALLASHPDYQVLIEVYTDNRGDEVALQQLTQERARVISARLESAGVEPSRIQANGMGASNPIASNASVAGRSRNRRTAITLTPLPARGTLANQ